MTDDRIKKENNGLSGAELVNPYDDRREKADQVEEMFDSIAPAYDFMNTAMTGDRVLSIKPQEGCRDKTVCAYLT